MNKYDWSNVPKEVKWIATDFYGGILGFEEKPKIFKYAGWGHLGETPFHVIKQTFKGNWQDSLEERPND